MDCPNFFWNNNPGATSAEFDNQASHPVVIFMPEISKTHMGGTMRLGLRPTVFGASTEEWSKVRGLYGGAGKVWERHRHRYEVNPDYIDRLKVGGLDFMGKDEKGERMQFLELRGTSPLHVFVGHRRVWNLTFRFVADHPFFVGLQAHPEFCSRPLNPSPPFLGFIAAASGEAVLREQVEAQKASFRPPHPENAMISEQALRDGQHLRKYRESVLTNGHADPESS
jgi:CTP synthase